MRIACCGTKVLIWDFDGTLGYRSGGMWSAALLEVIRQELPDLPVTIEQIRLYLEASFPWHTPERPHPEIQSADGWWDTLIPVFERALRGVGLLPAQACVLAGRVRQVYLDPARWRLFDGALPALEQLSSLGWTHVVLSNHVPELHAIIDHLGLTPHLARVFNSAQTGYEKPHPRAFKMVLEAFPGAAPVWMIGDSVHFDIVGAESVGIPAILVQRHRRDVKYHCHTLSQVVSIVQADFPPGPERVG